MEEARVDSSAHWRGIGLRLGAHTLVVPIDAVFEVRPLPALARVPGGAPWLLGVGNANGRMLTVNDLAVLTGVDPDPGADRQLLVVERDGHLRGFTVDDVRGVARYADASPAADTPGGLARMLSGAARCGDELAGVLDATALLDASAAPCEAAP